MMTATEIRTAVQRWIDDIWSKGDTDAVDEVLAPDFAFILTFLRTDGVDDFKKLLHINRTAFENLTYVAAPGDVIVEGDKAVAYWTMTARHVETWQGIEPTGVSVSIEGMTFFRFRDGKLADARVHNDVMGLRRQLGAV